MGGVSVITNGFALLGIVLVLLSSSFVEFVSCGRRHLPLHGDDGFRKSSQAAECQFGKQLRELGSSWFADLGPPFGVMYCIKCECLPYQKKRRVVGKVHCRNIKHECPRPTCDEPVLAPGKCCKVCPGDLNSPDFVEDTAAIISVDDERNTKHFAALLTARIQPDTSMVTTTPSSSNNAKEYLATGRFSFHKRNLYYSFYSTSRPRGLQFVDLKGNILEEQVLIPNSVYQNGTGKVCGVWRRIPREYRKLIREEKLLVTLLWERADLSISGQLYRYRALNTELYSTLLEGNGAPMSGGTAIISVSTAAPSIHLTIIFTGVFTADDVSSGNEMPVAVKLTSADGKTTTLEEMVKLDKISAELNVIEVRSAVTQQDLHLLARHQLMLTVSAGKSGANPLTGLLTTRTACEIFHAPLAPPTDNTDVITTTVSGLTWMYVNRNGGLNYHVQLDNTASNPTDMIIGLVVERRLVELEDVTPTFDNGWANGTIDDLSVRHLEQLYNSELAINVATTESRSLVRGKLVGRPLADARDTNAPMLLQRHDLSTPADLVGLIWAAVDIECNLHYEVVISGLDPDHGMLQLYLEEIPFIAPGAPVTRRLLEEFNSPTIEDFILGLTPQELLKLDSGVVYLDVKDTRTQRSILKAQWKEIMIPMSCLPHYSENNVPALNYNNDATAPEQTGCFHGDRFHDEGTQWESIVEHCVMCTCHNGRVSCDNVQCPATTCSSPVLKPDQCCPTCDNSIEGNQTAGNCLLAGQVFQAGATWHPYLPPNGFDTCATCYCNSSSLKVKCTRTECPQLQCDERVAIRKSGCCKICPSHAGPSVGANAPTEWMGDQQGAAGKTKAEVLAAGGCNYPIGGPFENGEEWHPRVYSHGEVKWVKCHCKDSKVRCERNRSRHH